ncbi:helix-turn-helix domain-containing protein [Streptomyces alkaliphilus]|nr:helix-turn-helix domain-containing protein [Streptomyces alkaliphilus]
MGYGNSAEAEPLTVLELLAREAPRSSFDDLMRGARGRMLSEAGPARLERAVQLGLTVQAAAESGRRREAAMASLVDTARDMIVPDDPEALLGVITRRARRLLGLDMAFITLRKPESGSYVHSSDGETTMLTVDLQIDEGYGIGEAPRGRRAPWWTADYPGDDSFPHSEQLDRVVRAEGLRAVLAVPLTHDEVTLGILYCADRKLRHFTPDEVSLTRSLADLAAVAFERSRLLERTRTELVRRELAHDSERVTTARLACLVEARDKLNALVLDGGDIAEVARRTAEALGGSVVMYGTDGKALAGDAGVLAEVEEAMAVKALLSAIDTGAPVRIDDRLWVAPAVAGGEEPGGLLLCTDQPLTEGDVRFLVFAGRTAGLVLLLRRNTAMAAGPLREEFLDELLSDPPRSPCRTADRARRLGIDPDRRYSVVVVRPVDADRGQAAVWAASHAYRESGLGALHGDCVVLLLPREDAADAAAGIHRELSPLLSGPLTVGAAGPAQDLAAIREVYDEARRCLDALIALGGRGGHAAARDLGFVGLLLSDGHDVTAYIGSVLGSVLRHDEQRDAGLVRTLEAYFAAGASPTRAAKVLHVHPNTVSRRLERLTGLLGPDWQEPARTLELQLALRLLRTRAVLGQRRTAAPGDSPEPSHAGRPVG